MHRKPTHIEWKSVLMSVDMRSDNRVIRVIRHFGRNWVPLRDQITQIVANNDSFATRNGFKDQTKVQIRTSFTIIANRHSVSDQKKLQVYGNFVVNPHFAVFYIIRVYLPENHFKLKHQTILSEHKWSLKCPVLNGKRGTDRKNIDFRGKCYQKLRLVYNRLETYT